MKYKLIILGLILTSCQKMEFKKKEITISSVSTTEQTISIKNETGEDKQLYKFTIGDLNNPNSLQLGNLVITNGNEIKFDSIPFKIKTSGAIIQLKNENGTTVDTWQN